MTTTENPVVATRHAGTLESTAPSYNHRQILVIMSGLAVGLLLGSLDQTIVTTALTRISEDFHRVDLYSWVVTAYLLASTASTPLYGKISDQFGRKRIFQMAIIIFLVGSALSGLAQNMYQLVAFRGLQGLGAGGTMTLALAIVGDVIAPRDRGRYLGYFGAIYAFSSVIGPLIGGVLVDQASWRWVFYINLPIGLAGLLLINRVLKVDHRSIRSKVDVMGSVLVVGGVSLFLVGVQMAGSASRLTSTSWAFIVSGLLVVVAFVVWERRAQEPIIPLHLFKDRTFTVSDLIGFVSGTVMFGAVLFMPEYFQLVRGLTPTVSGLSMLPMLAGVLLTSISSGRAVSRLGRYKVFVVAGTAVLAAGLVFMSTVSVSTEPWTLAAMLFVVGCGMGMFMQVLTIAVQNSVAPRYMGVATASVTFFRTLGGAVGGAVLGTVLILNEKQSLPGFQRRFGPGLQANHHAFVYGLDKAFAYAIPAAILAFLLSLLLREVRLGSNPRRGTDGDDASGSAAVESMIG